MEVTSLSGSLLLAAFPIGFGAAFFLGGILAATTGYLQLFFYSWDRWPNPGIHAWKMMAGGTLMAITSLIPLVMWGLPVLDLLR